MNSSPHSGATTVFDLGSGVCVNATNCTIYANNETQWLWWDYNSAGSGFVIFELASWDPSYHAVNQYICGDPNLTPGGSSGVSTFAVSPVGLVVAQPADWDCQDGMVKNRQTRSTPAFVPVVA